jgi:hypothetical protein
MVLRAKQSIFLMIVFAAVLGPGSGVAQIATPIDNFSFDYRPDASNDTLVRSRPNVVCNIPGYGDFGCVTGTARDRSALSYVFSPDTETPFLQEQVVLDGTTYWHIIVGQPESGFAQEFYARAGGVQTRTDLQSDTTNSGGASCFPGDSAFWNLDRAIMCLGSNNAIDPLSADNEFSGNGSGNPTTVIMRQLVTDPVAGFTQEFAKDDFNQKPIISQQLVTDGIDSNFVMDMSNSDYATDSVAGNMTNTIVVSDPFLPDGDISFDVVANSDATNITGGRYTFSPGRMENIIADLVVPVDTDRNPATPDELVNTQTTVGVRYQGREYVYYDGSVDPVADVDWASFKDPLQNP